MALNLTEQHALAVDPAFVDRVEQAVVGAAVAISSESPATAGYGDRISLATSVLRNSRDWARRFAVGIPTQAVGNNVSDNEIRNIVAALWSAYAGVRQEVEPPEVVEVKKRKEVG